ncbi:MAG: copper resistance CopC family protein [Alphaproteobacteria bacterium]
MIRSFLKLTLGAFLMASLLAPTAMAHTKVQSATLEDGGVYQTMPAVFDLVFAQKVGLATFSLKDSEGKDIAVDFTPPKSREEKFSIPMPKFQSGLYEMTWRAISKDGHIVKGGLSFTVQ